MSLRAGPLSQHAGVADQHEGRNRRAPTRRIGKKGYVGANPGGIAEGEGKRSFGTVHCDPAIGKTLRSVCQLPLGAARPDLSHWRKSLGRSGARVTLNRVNGTR